MCKQCDRVKREIERLQKWLKNQQCRDNPRKIYWRDYYQANRDKKLAAAKEKRSSQL